MTVAKATIIADSISPAGKRLTSVEVVFHRFILAELNTHRQFSRNYRSSRAVPAKKLIEEVRSHPALPSRWLSNKPGMQGGDELSKEQKGSAEAEWFRAADAAATSAERLDRLGLHKSWVNRLIEPFLRGYGIITATEWSNFFALRCHPDAQPEIRELADAIRDAMAASKPRSLTHQNILMQYPGDWHLPYVSAEDALNRACYNEKGLPDIQKLQALSVARCASVSYKTADGKEMTIERALALYDKLLDAKHMSPFEHQATPDIWEDSISGGDLGHDVDKWLNPEQHGNFIGWRQYRRMLPGGIV